MQSRQEAYRQKFPHLPEPVYTDLVYERLPEAEMLRRARTFYEEMNRRRTTRHFASDPVPRELIEHAIRTAGTAPSGAHCQPWRYVAIDDPALKAQIRAAAEEEEYKTYMGRMSEEWRQALAPLGTDWVKEHITTAPWVVVVFAERWRETPDGRRAKNYYVEESVSISVGLFITAVHHMGLATLTHTPNPTAFLNGLLNRPKNEAAVLLLPVGYPAPDAKVPALQRKPLDQIVQWNDGR